MNSGDRFAEADEEDLVFLIVALCLQLFSLTSCSSVKGKTQNPSIFGKVLDAQSGLPISHATMIICREKQLCTRYLTDEDGRFHVSEPFLKIGYSYRRALER